MRYIGHKILPHPFKPAQFRYIVEYEYRPFHKTVFGHPDPVHYHGPGFRKSYIYLPGDRVFFPGNDLIDLLNGALKSGSLKLLSGHCDALRKEWVELPWDEGRGKESPGL